MKKVLFIHHGEGIGGALVALVRLIEELKINNSVEVLCIYNSEAVKIIEDLGVKVHTVNSKFYLKFYKIFLHTEASFFSPIDFYRNSKNFITFYLSKYFFAKRELQYLNSRYDIVYLNSCFITDWALASRIIATNTIIHVREPLAKGFLGIRKALITRNIHKYCDEIIAVSQDNFERLSLNFKKHHVVYDPVVDTEKKGITTDDKFKYFIYLGGMQRIKGFEQLVKSLDFLDENIKIFFIGIKYKKPQGALRKLISFTDPYTWKIGKLESKLYKSKNIIDVGLVKNTFDYYNKSVGLISPFSKPHASLPVLEAFYLGKPVIVSDIEGINELVNVNNGIIFKNNDFVELAKSINNLANMDYRSYKSLSINAKKSYQNIKKNNISVQTIIDSF